jgi:outer membrane protein TolC
MLPIAFACALGCPVPAAAQVEQARAAGANEPWRLAQLQDAAINRDPRLRELQLQPAQAELRVRNIEVERLPSVTAEAQAQYQSDVLTFPFARPGEPFAFMPPKRTYDASVRLDQRIVDPTLGPRVAAERAALSEAQTRVRTAVFGLRQEVNDAFFGAALVQERVGAFRAAVADLEARLREVTVRVREGTALPSDAASIEATLLQRQQDVEELAASRRAALTRLGALTGRSIGEDDVLEIPELAAAVDRARAGIADTRARPEYEHFARTRERLARQQDVAIAQQQPRLSAFARVGYGRPGLNPVNDRFDSYGIVGLQAQWKAWTWGTASRDRRALALQREIVSAEEAAFTDALARTVDGDLTAIDRLAGTVALDERIVALREDIERSAGVRFRESVLTASEYVDRSTDLLEARYARAAHRVELAEARARFLTTLGLEVR